MSTTFRTAALRVAMAATATAIAATAAAAPLYRIQKLDRPDGIEPEHATAISSTGIVVGYGRTPDESSFVPYIRKRHKTLPLEQPGVLTRVWSVNARGEVAGESDGHAFRWDESGHAIDMDALAPCQGEPGSKTSRATSINDAGTVTLVAECRVAGVWQEKGFVVRGQQVTELPDFGDGRSYASAVNNHDQVAGSSVLAPNADGYTFRHALRWQDGTTIDLGTGGGCCSHATAINDLGHMALYSNDETGHQRLYVSDGRTMHKLFNCARRFPLVAAAINNHDVVVANVETEEGYLFEQGHCHRFVDLMDDSGEGWSVMTLHGINDDGVAVGEGVLNGHWRAFIATPVTR